MSYQSDVRTFDWNGITVAVNRRFDKRGDVDEAYGEGTWERLFPEEDDSE